jgi:uncharacterized protein YjbJ (UPF0337 family)
MTPLETKGYRHIAKGKLKQKRAKFADDNLKRVEGKSEELLGRIQKHTVKIQEAMTDASKFTNTIHKNPH